MIELLTAHSSVRRYKDEPISDEQFKKILHAASSHFVQAYSVIQVKDEEKKEQLGRLSRNELQFKTAALSLIFCADLKRGQYAVRKHGKDIVGNTAEDFTVATIDTALLAQNFVIAAEAEGYGICYIGGVRNNPEAISKLFELPEYVIPLFGMTVGIPAEENEVKPRLPVDSIVHVDKYEEAKYEGQLHTYDEVFNEYYQRRTRNKKDLTWTETMADFLPKERRTHLKDFLVSKGFLNE